MSDALTLEVVAGKAAGTKVDVSERIVFGRDEGEPAQLGGDPGLSRSHAEIIRGTAGAYLISDLASTNGTFVNGARVQAPLTLSRGDIVDIGTSRLVVRTLPAVASPATGGDGDPRDQTVIFRVPPAMRETASSGSEPIELHLSIDPARGEARIALGSGGDVVTLRQTAGRWTLATD
jgi:pSer/pThr/pTyr-binding forkhead associated (FHA) protein